MRRQRAAALAATLVWVAPGGAATAPTTWVADYPRLAAQAERDCDAARFEDCRATLQRVHDMLDGRPDIGYRLAKVEARLGHAESSLRWLELYALSELDLGDPASAPEFRALLGDRRFAAIERSYQSGLRPVGQHGVIATAPAKDLIAEDLALDPHDGSMFVSSVREGRLLQLDAGGHWSDFARRAELGAWGLYALAVDSSRGRLWLGSVAGAVSPPFKPEDAGRSVVLQLDLRTRRVMRRYELRDGHEHAFGDMALAADGTLYVSDGVGGGVYRIGRHAGAALEPVVGPGQLRSPQTPVPLPGERLLVADYSRGIAVIDLRHAPGSPTWLAHPPQLALYGIDGLYLRGQMLIAVQNGTVPERVLLLHLDPALTRIVRWEVALARVRGLGDPTHGLVVGHQFQFIANSGWDRVDDAGRMRAAGEAGAPAIWSIELPE